MNEEPSVSVLALANPVVPKVIRGVPVHSKSQCTFNQAAAESEHLQQLPPGLHKWTWGPKLSASDVHALVHLGPPTHPHSRYRATLPNGPHCQYLSPDPSLLTVQSAAYSNLASNIVEVPEVPQNKHSVSESLSEHNHVPTSRHSDHHQVAGTAEADPFPIPRQHITSAAYPSATGIDDTAAFWSEGSNNASLPHDSSSASCEGLNIDADQAGDASGDSTSEIMALKMSGQLVMMPSWHGIPLGLSLPTLLAEAMMLSGRMLMLQLVHGFLKGKVVISQRGQMLLPMPGSLTPMKV